MLLPLKAVISRKPRRDGLFVIYYQYCFSSVNRVLLSTSMAIPPLYWNAKRQCISKTLPNEIGNCEELNNQLGRIRKIVEAIIEQGLAIGEPNIGAYVKSLYKPGFTMDSLQTKTAVVPKSKKEPDFFGELDNYIQSKEKVVCEKGLVNFRTMKGRLLAFEESRKKKITFSSLDYNFYMELVAFFTYDYQLNKASKINTTN